MSLPSHSAVDPSRQVDVQPPPPPSGGGNWPETDHPALARLREGTAAEKGEALRQLFFAYSPPLKSYIRHHWPRLQEEDIDDLATEFTTHCLTGDKPHFLTYDPGAKVRLRTYLCTILDNYLRNRHRHASAQIRGGNRQFESLDTTNPAAHQERPADASGDMLDFDTDTYDRHWAQHILRIAFSALETGTPASREALPLLQPWILADPGDATLKEIARGMGRTHAALRAQLHRLRKTWRQAVRDAVARTVSHPDEIDDELRHLATVLSRHPLD